MKYYVGIDPGLSGALAFYDPKADELRVYDMPTVTHKVAGKKKHTLSLSALAGIIDTTSTLIIKAMIEEVGAMPKQGVTSSFNFGFSAGVTHMAIAAYFIPYATVRPGVWKRAMGITKDKEGARREASRLLPKHAGLWPLVKHDGRAEAALLAYYLAKHDNQGASK